MRLPWVFIGSAQQQFLLSLLCSVMSQGCKTSLWKRKSTPGVLGLWLLKDELCFPFPCLRLSMDLLGTSLWKRCSYPDKGLPNMDKPLLYVHILPPEH